MGGIREQLKLNNSKVQSEPKLDITPLTQSIDDYERLKRKYPLYKNASYDLLLNLELTVNKPSLLTFISSDNRTEAQRKQNEQAFKEQEQREAVRKNVDIADRTVGKIATWTPFGGLYDAYSGALLRDYGYNDEARLRGVSAAIRMPFDFMGGAWAAAKPLQFATSTAGALAGDYVADKTNLDGLGRFVLTGIGGATGAGIPSFTRNITSRFTPDGWFTLGNKLYRPSLNTMSSGVPTVESRPIWQLQEFPGYLIKSLFKGSPLEKLLSKNGTLSLKLLLAYVNRNDVSSIDKELLNRVLLNHANDTHVDYNTLRLEVLGMIPLYNRVSLIDYATYGMNKLGFPIQKVSDGAGGLVDVYSGFKPQTFTFESPGIKGNAKHYDQNTLGHSRTYTTADEPNVLHIMESLSDWALSGGISNSVGKRRVEQALEFTKRDLESGNYGFYTKEDLELKVADLTKQLLSYELDPIKSNMVKTYLNRLLQENLKYAAENGLTIMRYPTRETAAKIEGYSPLSKTYTREQVEIAERNHDLLIQELRNIDQLSYYKSLENYLNHYPNDLEAIDLLNISKKYFLEHPTALEVEGINPSLRFIDNLNRIDGPIQDWTQKARVEARLKYVVNLDKLFPSPTRYSPAHETILKKYTDFPKQFLKLFGKKTEVRIATDTKGNAWYEVDVPLNYLNGTAEMLFKKGGKLNIVERFKKNRK